MVCSTQIELRKEAVLTVSGLIKTLDVDLLWSLLAERLSNLLPDYFKCMQLYSHGEVVLAILDTLEYLLGLDEELGLENYYSYHSLIDSNSGFDWLDEVQKLGNEVLVARAHSIIDTFNLDSVGVTLD